jgi:hypothetical protein
MYVALLIAAAVISGSCASVADQQGDAQADEVKREERREFQSQELMLAKSGSWIFKLDETPRILWRDAETVRRLGCDEPLRVRWFDAELNESPEPHAPGRWLAWIQGTAPNRSPQRSADEASNDIDRICHREHRGHRVKKPHVILRVLGALCGYTIRITPDGADKSRVRSNER